MKKRRRAFLKHVLSFKDKLRETSSDLDIVQKQVLVNNKSPAESGQSESAPDMVINALVPLGKAPNA